MSMPDQPFAPRSSLYIGIMSGTSLDGADAVLADFSASQPHTLAHCHAPFPAALRAELLALQAPGENELHRAALAANALVDHYAGLVRQLLADSGHAAADIAAIGAHGQTIRHRPELGFTLQLNAPARLAEQCGIDVIADLRSRDIAAGGQGAPLVPAFHAGAFGVADRHRVVVNIGGISNLTDLPPDGFPGPCIVRGWDCGPGNLLLDGWILQHQNLPFDAAGTWAASGNVIPEMLEQLLDEPWLKLPPPRSTGRDLFNAAWLDEKMMRTAQENAHFRALLRTNAHPCASDIQATLSEFTAATIASSIIQYIPAVDEVLVCGGGALNLNLLERLARRLSDGLARTIPVHPSSACGVAPDQVESLAFAWLARQFMLGQPGNLPSVTGAGGPRLLGALYPA